MEIAQKIDQLINGLNSLKPLLSEDNSANTEKFNKILRTSITNSQEEQENSASVLPQKNSNTKNMIPVWVNDSYSYLPSSPRKPNMREMIEALAGKSMDELYADKSSNWQTYSTLASEILYSSVDDENDTRNWEKIMSSSDILIESGNELNKIHKANLDIAAEYDSRNQVIGQQAVIRGASGKILKSLTGTTEDIENSLKIYGMNKNTIPTELKDRIYSDKFDASVVLALNKLQDDENSVDTSFNSKTVEALSLKAYTGSISAELETKIIEEDIERSTV